MLTRTVEALPKKPWQVKICRIRWRFPAKYRQRKRTLSDE